MAAYDRVIRTIMGMSDTGMVLTQAEIIRRAGVNKNYFCADTKASREALTAYWETIGLIDKKKESTTQTFDSLRLRDAIETIRRQQQAIDELKQEMRQLRSQVIVLRRYVAS